MFWAGTDWAQCAGCGAHFTPPKDDPDVVLCGKCQVDRNRGNTIARRLIDVGPLAQIPDIPALNHTGPTTVPKGVEDYSEGLVRIRGLVRIGWFTDHLWQVWRLYRPGGVHGGE